MTFYNNPNRNAWRPEEDALLRQHFGLMEDQALADLIGRPVLSLSGRANRIRIRKEDNRARKANPAPIPAMGATARAIICNSVMRGAPYLCPELRPFDGRPGAMDAFALPSRRFDRRVYRDGRVEGVA